MDIVTIDFETYYDQDFSLSKMTTEAYVRDPRFEVIGVGVKVNDYPTDWYSGDNPGRFLKSLDYRNKAILCHNAAFDGAILSWHFGIKPKLWLDTLSMARPLHNITVGGSLAVLAVYYGIGTKGDEVIAARGKHKKDFTEEDLARYGQYCVNDVDLTKQLFDKLKVGFPSTELLVIDQTIRMYTEPVIELDIDALQKHLVEVKETKQKLLDNEYFKSMDGEEMALILMSNEKFAAELQRLGVDPPTKISTRTGKETWAFAKTDKGMTDLLDHPDVRVQGLVSARLGVKSTLEETRTEALLGVASRGRLPIMLNYYGAHTGRFSGGDKLNLQNLPSRGNTIIRKALKAPPEHVLVACDSSQIEARMVAWLAGQDALVQAFREARDVYSEFATEVYGRKITKADKVERFVGKTCLAAGTRVLTRRGWIPIVEVSITDQLWDGVEWVSHSGVLFMGVKPTIKLHGVELTPDHEILTEHSRWVRADHALIHDSVFQSALNTATLPLSVTNNTHPQKQGVVGDGIRYAAAGVAVVSIRTQAIISKLVDQLLAMPVQNGRQVPSGGGNISLYSPTISIGRDYSTVLPQQLPVATLHPTGRTSTTASAVFGCAPSGVLTERSSYGTSRPSTAGTIRFLRWIGSMWTGITNRGTSASYHGATTSTTNAKSQTLKRVYDILNSGSRNRFTILTEAGPLIVHNCILGLGYGMGSEKLQRTLELGQGGINVKIDLNEAERIVRIYRAKNFRIVQLWNKCARALSAMLQGDSGSLHDILSYDASGITLPNKFKIQYPALRKTGNGFEYIGDARMYRKAVRDRVVTGTTDDITWTRIYGGKVTENLVQALASIVIREQMAAAGQHYKVAFQVHDEIIISAPKAEAGEAKAKLIEIMSTPPKWAPQLPVACEAGYADNYGDT